MSDERRAIEALRAGVPNRVAIRLLGTAEAKIYERFVENLQSCKKRLQDGGQATGQVIAGDFGTGKSHLLGCLQDLALKENFIVSWVVISKETPLFDLGKLYVSAIRNATVPNHNDDAMTAVLSKFGSKGDDAYDELLHWAESVESGLSPLFAGLLYLFPHPNTYPERAQQIARFFAGGKLRLTDVKQWLREVGAVERFPLKPIKQPDLILQRLSFVPRLIVAAGYSGWVLLLDEVELIGRYSLLQRSRSYAELARWLGLDADERAPGVVTVAAITEDFTSEVIRNRRDDEHAPKILSDKNERKAAERARLGITTLEKPVLLQTPTAELLQVSLNKIRRYYSDAYGWDATEVAVGEITKTKSMRQYIKSWITTWDLERLYGIRPEIETVVVVSDYEENADIEKTTEPGGDGPDDE